jgi:DNA processing protein
LDKPSTIKIDNGFKLKCLSIHLAKLQRKFHHRITDIPITSIEKYSRLIKNYAFFEKESYIVLQRSKEASIEITSIFEKNYPPLLRLIPDPPVILFSTSPLYNEEKLITAVGTRDPSTSAEFYASRVSSILAQRGYTVVSGMARGIDQAVHRGSLETGKTIAVMAQGLDIPISKYFEKYRGNNQLNLVSEYAPGTQAKKYYFPRRNRILAGLSPTTLFIEGHYKSGAIITANLAADYGRDVFAAIHSSFKKKEGAYKLISEGAGNLCKSFSLKNYNRCESNKSLIELLENRFCSYLGQGRWQLVKPRNCQQSFKFFN